MIDGLLSLSTLLAAVAWLGLLAVPWRPWSVRERLEADPTRAEERLDDVVALVPARDEAATLPATLDGLAAQGPGLAVVVVDDQSADGTAEVARASDLPDLHVVAGAPLPAGWSGKVWAQHQGLHHADRELVLLLDADITLAPGTVATLRAALRERGLGMISLMARLAMDGRWERLTLPAFVYFFKLLYPFALVARPSSRVAAAAGGCVLVRRDVLLDAGGFEALRDALIDDCTLARLVKRRGHSVWLGLTSSVVSRRRYLALGEVWRMVARTAYTQLRYSPLALIGCTVAMLVVLVAPLLSLVVPSSPLAVVAAAVALLACALGYRPLLRYYGLAPWRAATLPIAGVLFLLMTWDSALRYHRGERSAWRGRRYGRE
ncbi:MAG: glycosyltransferase [Ectothiorhodospiraceae bacterium]|nr:glycosyltransferase [Ectothiorhodospiraceae bacterium]